MLRAEQRWHVINYMRTLAPRPAAAPVAVPAAAPGRAPATRPADPTTQPRLASGRGAPVRPPATRPAATPPATGPISREEYERLRREVESLRKELAEVRAAAPPQDAQAQQQKQDAVDEAIRDLQKHIESESSTTSLLIAGNATLGYIDRKSADSTFTAVFRPLVLWKLSDRLLFESKLELTLPETGDAATVSLESANLTYLVNDYLTIGGGKFFSLFGLFNDRFYPGKLADVPLIYARPDGLAPHTQLGAFARGAIPLNADVGATLGLPPEKRGQGELNYAAWISNGPLLRTADETRAGALDFTNFRDSNGAKDFGGRVGFLPFPALEVGASILYCPDVTPHGFDNESALLYGLDLHYFDYIEAIKGTLDLRAEYVWSDVGDATFDPSGSAGFGPVSFNNFRHGGYVEAGYRPTRSKLELLRDFEFVGRYDRLEESGPARGDRDRLTLGVLYWINATTHLRVGYMFDNPDRGTDQSGLFIQASVGF
jgi:hypothetical protein